MITHMTTESISIQVDADAARAYRSASDEERRKLDLILSLAITEATSDRSSLEERMREIGRNTRSRGLTPENLGSILDERSGA